MSAIRDIENKAVEALLCACHPFDRIIGAELQEALAKRERIEAAAPELLDLLKWLDQIGGLGLTVHERIRAAIAKAEGRE